MAVHKTTANAMQQKFDSSAADYHKTNTAKYINAVKCVEASSLLPFRLQE
jgi:hypothetical protein